MNITQTINPKSQQIYSQVVAACPLPDGTICPEPFNSLLYFDLDEYSDEAYNSVPESIRQKINLTRGNERADSSAEVVSADVPL